MATITITVTVANPGSGNRYYLDGVLQATYVATPGNTYKFDQADGSNSGHPLRLSITSNGTHSGGSAYTTGVTTSGTPGSSGAYTQIEVTATTVQALYYYCTNHSNMGGSFNTGSSATVQYQDREGFPVQNFSADQTSVGQIYYNSTSGQFKAVVDGAGSGTWASGGNMNTARYRMFGGFAPHSEGLVAGGQAPAKANVENYNGTSWTEEADIPTAMSDSGMIGVYTAGVLAGGEPASGTTNEALHWNGSAWTEVTNMPVSLERCSGSGVQTAGMITGGRNPSSPGGIATNLEYDGTNWTTGGSIPVGTYNIATQGPQTSAIAAGGVQTGAGSGSTAAYTYNGSAWTAVSSLNTATYESGWSSQGEGATRALIFGGNDAPARPTTQFWDGTSWTELNDLSTGRAAGGSFGGVNNAVYAGGSPPTMATTEEWTQETIVVKTLTTS